MTKEVSRLRAILTVLLVLALVVVLVSVAIPVLDVEGSTAFAEKGKTLNWWLWLAFLIESIPGFDWWDW